MTPWSSVDLETKSVPAASELAMKEFDLEKFFNLSVDMLCIAGTDGYFKRINPAFERVLGWSTEELLGCPFWELIHPDDVASTLEEMENLKLGEPTVLFENRYRCADGTYKYLLWTAFPEPETGLLYAVAHDITGRKSAQEKILQQAQQLEEANRKLTHQATTDVLSGLKNRRALVEQMDMALRLARRTGASVSLLMLDVDYFKSYNDEFGHPAGDEVLVALGELLSKEARGSDFVARYGGEEFAVFLPDTDVQGALTAGSRFLEWP